MLVWRTWIGPALGSYADSIVYMVPVCVCMIIHIYIYICRPVYVCMYVCMYVCIYLFIYLSIYLSIYVSMYLCFYVCMYLSMYLCIYVSMCIYIYTHNLHVYSVFGVHIDQYIAHHSTAPQQPLPSAPARASSLWRCAPDSMQHPAWSTVFLKRVNLKITVTINNKH